MGSLEDNLERLIASTRSVGFGDPDAFQQHLREIDHARFKITRRDNIRTALLFAVIGAAVGGAVSAIVSSIIL